MLEKNKKQNCSQESIPLVGTPQGKTKAIDG